MHVHNISVDYSLQAGRDINGRQLTILNSVTCHSVRYNEEEYSTVTYNNMPW